jgi:uncharacterized surface protein with fasciclin (FAS1) repeats
MYAMEKTLLTYLLEEDGPYTVFAPVQSSFTIFRKENKITHIDQFPEGKLAEILRYHIIPGRWSLSSIPEGYHPTLLPEKTTGNPIDLYIEKYDLFRLNGQVIIDEPDLATINGYIQSIKSVLDIPAILDHLLINRDFSLILEMLSRKDLDMDYLTLLSDEHPDTFLAPTNEAILSFIDRNPDWQTIDDISSHTLNELIGSHLFRGENIVMNEIPGDLTLTSMKGNDVTVRMDYPKWSIMDGNKKIARINIRNIQAVNGIIHQIDRVLLP